MVQFERHGKTTDTLTKLITSARLNSVAPTDTIVRVWSEGLLTSNFIMSWTRHKSLFRDESTSPPPEHNGGLSPLHTRPRECCGRF